MDHQQARPAPLVVALEPRRAWAAAEWRAASVLRAAPAQRAAAARRRAQAVCRSTQTASVPDGARSRPDWSLKERRRINRYGRYGWQ